MTTVLFTWRGVLQLLWLLWLLRLSEGCAPSAGGAVSRFMCSEMCFESRRRAFDGETSGAAASVLRPSRAVPVVPSATEPLANGTREKVPSPL